jgi:tetratricopeptide (TPR) repeat protein
VDAVVRAEAEEIAGRIELGLGDFAAAHDWFARALEGFSTLGLLWGAGSALLGMTTIPLETNDADQAERLLNEATFVLQHAGPWFMARALIIRAILAVRRGAADEAIVLVRQSLTHIRDLHDKWAFVHSAVPLAAAAALKGDDPWAARVLGARDVVVERTGATIVMKPVHDMSAQIERDLRERLGPDRWALAYAAGRQASLDSLLSDIGGALPSTT